MREGRMFFAVLLFVGIASPVGAEPSQKPACDDWGCGMNGPRQTGLRAEARVTGQEIVSVTLASGESSDFATRTPPFKPTLPCGDHGCGVSATSIDLDSFSVDVAPQPPPPTKPACDDFGCGMNGPQRTGLRFEGPSQPGKPQCDDWGCGMNGPQWNGMRAELTVSRHQVSSVTLASGLTTVVSRSTTR